jgi:hypothetical protein
VHSAPPGSLTRLFKLPRPQPTGARAGNIIPPSGSAFDVYIRSSNPVEVQRALAGKRPATVFLKTGSVDYGSMDIFHTAVLTSLDALTVAIHDPYFARVPQTTSLQNLEKAWAETGQFAAMLRPRKKS